ncbi:hypothetical protein [Kineococcus sp. SYSU DK001]|uniref:hypothetical protein n=1 Tax=Kineococcus sp. SYSU DK001 TaxID=3383122 RepID=UPI003D7D494C
MTLLADLAGAWAGAWAGENAFRLLPADAPHTAPATAVVQVAGAMTTVGYAWAHPEDGDQAGLLTLGPGDGEGSVVALWGDSWHQAPQARVLLGTSGGSSVTVGYDYVEGQWRWEVTLRAAGDGLELRMDNVPLATGEGHTAMLASLRRA